MNCSTGLLNCVITGTFSKCVTVLLGHVNTDDNGPVEIWGNFSERGLLSLKEDLLRPEAEPTRTYRVGPGECCVTSQEAECIHAKVADIPEFHEGQATGRIAQVWACLSLAGINQLLEQLKRVEAPLNLAPVVEARAETPYGWRALRRDGQVISQFPVSSDDVEEREVSFREVGLDQVVWISIHPRVGHGLLPWYSLEDRGFYHGCDFTSYGRLPLLVPDEPFHFHYYRRVTVTVFCAYGTGEPQKPRIVQVIGWRVERPDGDLVCELGIEEDGSHSIYRRGRITPVLGEFIHQTEEEFEQALAA